MISLKSPRYYWIDLTIIIVMIVGCMLLWRQREARKVIVKHNIDCVQSCVDTYASDSDRQGCFMVCAVNNPIDDVKPN